MRLGAHVSAAGGVSRAPQRARECGCEGMQIFTKNASQWSAPLLTANEVQQFRQRTAQQKISPWMAHASYLINLCSEGEKRKKSLAALLQEMERCEALGVRALVLHPGASLQLPRRKALKLAAQALSSTLSETEGTQTEIWLENTAGQGTCVGGALPELREIVEGVKPQSERLKICLDTCHAAAFGYPLHTEEGYHAFFALFEENFPMTLLAGFHLNDSKKAVGSRVDRHAPLGQGTLGLWLFWQLLRDSRFSKTPGVLETPPLPGRELHESFALQLKLLRKLAKRASPPPSPSLEKAKPPLLRRQTPQPGLF